MSMSVKVNVSIVPKKILADRGLGKSDAANLFLANEVKRLSDPYVPMQQGILKSAQVKGGSPATLVYSTPYAHYQWVGKAMGGRAPKHYTGKELTYHGRMRGKRWVNRMLSDKGGELGRSFAQHIGGKAK